MLLTKLVVELKVPLATGLMGPLLSSKLCLLGGTCLICLTSLLPMMVVLLRLKLSIG